MPATDSVIAIDLGGTKCAAALIDRDGILNHHKTVMYGDASGDRVGSLILEITEEYLALAESDRAGLNGIGISVPGIVLPKEGTVWAPNIAGWTDYPLQGLITENLSRKDLKVHIESDRTCAILGECWLGAARGSRNAIFLAVGTGIGAGILVDGEIIRGAHDIAGAIGWMALQRPYHEKLKPFGCFEYYASGDGLVRAARELAASQPTGSFPPENMEKLTARELFEAYDKGEPLARMVFAQAVELWGMAAANLVSLFNPEIIIFGGGVFGPGIRFLDQIYKEAGRWAQPIAHNQVQFRGSLLKGEAQLYGAAGRVFETVQI